MSTVYSFEKGDYPESGKDIFLYFKDQSGKERLDSIAAYVNDKGEILDFMLTQGNVDDREPLRYKPFHDSIFGKLFGDKGYICKSLFEQLFIDGIHLITKIRKNMKNCLMHFHDKIMLKKRALIETVNDELKNICQVEHTRHRSFDNFLTNLLSGLIAYSFFPKKPSINTDIVDNKALIAFA